MFGLGTTELVLILVIVLIIFGVGKLPDIGSGLGKAIKNFKRATDEAEIDVTPKEDKEKIEAESAQKKAESKEKSETHAV